MLMLTEAEQHSLVAKSSVVVQISNITSHGNRAATSLPFGRRLFRDVFVIICYSLLSLFLNKPFLTRRSRCKD